MGWSRLVTRCPKCGRKMTGELRFSIKEYGKRICSQCADKEIVNFKKTLRFIEAIEKTDSN